MHFCQTAQVPVCTSTLPSQQDSSECDSTQPRKRGETLALRSDRDPTIWPCRPGLFMEKVGRNFSQKIQWQESKTATATRGKPNELCNARNAQYCRGTRVGLDHNGFQERGRENSLTLQLGKHVSQSKRGTTGNLFQTRKLNDASLTNQ